MLKLVVTIVCALFLSCAKVKTATNENIQTKLIKTVTVSPTVEVNSTLKPVEPKIKLNFKQTKYLNESLPPKVREILEKAESFEVLAEVREQFDPKDNIMVFEPNRFIKINTEITKQKILEALYYDASREDSPAVCFEPRHQIKAEHQGKTVEIEICFSCSRFFVKSPFGEFEGTIVRENRKSENLFSKIIQD